MNKTPKFDVRDLNNPQIAEVFRAAVNQIRECCNMITEMGGSVFCNLAVGVNEVWY
jgi:hypothetical protein